MPEYSHIQTCVRCDAGNFKSVLKEFAALLSRVGLDNSYFCSGLEWELADNGFMYQGGNADAEEVPVEGLSLHVRPYVVGLTPEVFPELAESWLEINLLFRTEEIEADYRTGELVGKLKPYLWDLITQLSGSYEQSGVYFTSEVTDGKPWEAIITGSNAELWSFDAAVIPQELFERYEQPDDLLFYYTYNDNRLFLARREVWRGEPW
ncbi:MULTISPECIES: hypothetical protein [unclassified Paenibacillus]|uniref:hypothetical protein n=1 Tax=unclassified Paenibacillus TaxID=185978 RepID=UPI0024050A41|nr:MULTISPECIES: hypothetical protein [unclassified Paenibacillus]MDF9841516.1 hypothetical protein [Paenibacillus sp. PastF-2]MDF9848105.1 hypothetical protein [Paenibacillus sp. PastM-2]MDF9854674.1 hypothetical protein [Paenibacillus sp. PastF-1]MDH6479718.1 hypothetical protein [Paenibacillus sp. PastH-2]MDH6507379.1 hypothetical protein [Paenibacillus sp. PastM-3]